MNQPDKRKSIVNNPLIDELTNVENPVEPVNAILQGMTGFKRGTSSGLEDTDRGVNVDEYKPYLGKGMINMTSGSNYARAKNQSVGEQLAHAARVVPNTVLEFAGMLGNVMDVEDYNNVNNEVGNWLNNWAQEQKQNINDAAPIYRENPDQAFDVGDSGWWLENGTSLVESAVAFVGLGYITGGSALAGLTRIGKGMEFLNFLSKGAVASQKGQQLLRVGAGLANTHMLNQAEGIGIATSVYQQAYETSLKEIRVQQPQLSESEVSDLAKQDAANKASNAITLNRANQLLNLTSSFAFLKAPLSSRTNLLLPSVGRSAKRAGLEAGQEAMEEIINLGAEKAALKGDANYSDLFDETTKAMGTLEGAEAMFLGAVGGGGQTMLTNAGRNLKIRRDKNGERTSDNTLQTERFYEQEQQIAKHEAMNKAQKFSDVTDVYMRAKEHGELLDELKQARKDKDEAKVNTLKHRLVSNQAYDAFSSGTTESLLNFYKDIAKLDETAAEERGLDPKTYKEDTNKAISFIETLEKEYNKAQSYLDSYSVYDNKVDTISNNYAIDELENAKGKLVDDIYEDAENLNIKREDITFDEYSTPTFTNYKRYGQKKKDIIDNLASIKSLKEVKGRIKQHKDNREYLAKKHAHLTSNEYQDEVKKQVKEIASKKKIEAQEQRAKVKQAKIATKTAAKTSKLKHKKEDPTTPVTKPKTVIDEAPTTVEPVVPETVSTDFSFSFSSLDSTNADLKTMEDSLNAGLTRTDIDATKKIEVFKGLLTQEGTHPGILMQLNNAIRYLEETNEAEELQTETETKTNKKVEDSFDTFSDLVVEDGEDNLSPIEEDGDEDYSPSEENQAKIFATVKTMLQGLEEAGVDISDFNEVAINLQATVGKQRLVPMFDKFRDVYNVLRPNDRSNASYEEVFYSGADIDAVIKSQVHQYGKLMLAGVYNASLVEFEQVVSKAIHRFLTKQGYSAYEKDSAELIGLRIEEAYDTIAHLDRRYKDVIKGKKTALFNVLDFSISKEDLDNELNYNMSETLVDYNKLQEGEEITFVVLDELTLDDGSIVHKDGRVEYQDETVQDTPVNVAPIAIKYKGEILKGAFLHTPEWINELNIADPKLVDAQKAAMVKLRTAVLEAGEDGITTTITSNEEGHILFDAEGVYDYVEHRLPNVEIGIGKDGVIYTGTYKSIVLDMPVADRYTYAIFPTGPSTKSAFPIQNVKLKNKEEYVDSIINAVSLYIDNKADDPRVKSLLQQTNIDITTIKGLREFIDKFVYLNPNLKFKYNEFKEQLSHISDSVSIVRIADNNLEFGVGADWGGTIGFINRNIIAKDENPQKIKETQLAKLRKVLTHTVYTNVDRKKLNKKFQLPLIKNDKVEVTNMDYNDFVKTNTVTAQYSKVLKNGTEVYTVQRNIKYNTDFALDTPSQKKTDAITEIFGEPDKLPAQIKKDTTIDFDGDSLVIEESDEDYDESPAQNDEAGKEKTIKSISTFDKITNHSGGAVGADSMFDTIGKKYGQLKHNHYYYGEKSPLGNKELTDAQYQEGLYKVDEVKTSLGKFPTNEKVLRLLARNWFQVKNSTQIIAVAPINDNFTKVEGGTGWAVAMAQTSNREINVFNTVDDKWYRWNGTSFMLFDTPILHHNFAGIGSRQGGEMSTKSVKAIDDVYAKTFKHISDGNNLTDTLGENTIEDINPETDVQETYALTKEQTENIRKNISTSLIVEGIPPNLQTAMINYLSSKVLAKRNEINDNADAIDKKIKQASSFDVIDNFGIFLQKLTTSGELDKKPKLKKLISNILENYKPLVFLTLDNLRQNNNIPIVGKKLNYYKHLINTDKINLKYIEEVDQETDSATNSSWENDGIFRDDIKTKVGDRLRNKLSYIQNIIGFDKTKARKPILDTYKFLGLPKVVTMDTVFNEITGILAYNSMDKNLPSLSFDGMVNILKTNISFKPYLHNVVEVLNTFDETLQNQFVEAMTKHYTNHKFLYKNENGHISVNSSDGNAIVSLVQQHWLNNMIDSPIITKERGGLILDTRNTNIMLKQARDIAKRLKTINKVAPSQKEVALDKLYDEVKSVFDKLGFKFTKEYIKYINVKGIKYNKNPEILSHIFNNKDSAVVILLKRLDDIKGKDIQEFHPFQDNSSLFRFSRFIAKSNPSYFTNSFRDVRGNLYFAYSANKFIIDRVKALKFNQENVLDNLKQNSFSKDSVYVDRLANDDRFKDIFSYFTLDGLSIKDKPGKKLDQLSPAELEEVKVSLFHSQNRAQEKFNTDEYIGNFFYFTNSDKPVQMGIKSLGKNWSKYYHTAEKDIIYSEYEALFDVLVKPEVERIYTTQDNATSDRKNYNEGASMFHIIPSLNAMPSLWVEPDGVRKLRGDILTNEKVKLIFIAEIKKYVNKLADSKYKTWKDYGLIKTKTKQIVQGYNVLDVEDEYLSVLPDNENEFAHVRKDVLNFVINYLVFNVNMAQTFTTDPANYWKSSHWKSKGVASRAEAIQQYRLDDWIQEHEDTMFNMGKRLAGDSAPGSEQADVDNTSINIGHIADSEGLALNMGYLNRLLDGREDAYKNVSRTDAQGYNSVSEYLYLLNKQGTITSKQVKDFIKKDKTNSITKEEFDFILQPIKPVYVNNIWVNGTEHRLYIKYSAFPLFRQLTQGLEIDKLRAKMEKDKLDMVVYDSAVKTGGLAKPSVVFQNDGKIPKSFNITRIADYTPRKGYKIQQNVPYDETKKEGNDGTQQRKMLTASVRHIKGFTVFGEQGTFTGKEIQDKMDNEYNKLYKLAYDKLLSDLKYNKYTDSISIKKLRQTIISEGLQRKYPLYDLESIKIVKRNERINDLQIPLWFISTSGKIEALLNSIIDNRVRKIKTRGKSYVLGTPVGFKPTVMEGKDATEFIKNNTGIIFDKKWFKESNGELRNAEIVGNEIRPAEVMLPFYFFDNDGNRLAVEDYMTNGFLDYDKMDEHLLKLFGYRIPTQDLNSMATIKVVGFLPEKSGDLILAPQDWTVQMGSDFDVDKLFTNMYYTSVDENGRLVRYDGEDESKHIKNRILDLHFSILDNTNEQVQQLILTPLDFGDLINNKAKTDVVRDIYPFVKDNEEGIGFSEEYQSFKYRNARAGKAAVGVFSSDSTFNAILQGKGLYLRHYNPKIKKLVPTSFVIDGHMNQDLSHPFTYSGKTKASVIKAFQSVAVDNENEQGLHKLNVNNLTFDIIRALAMSGFEETDIAYLINQPIIRDYVKYKTLAQDNSADFTNEDLDNYIEAEYDADEETLVDIAEEEREIIYSPTLANLKTMLEAKDNVLYANEQRLVLDTFYKLSKIGKNLQAIQSAINTDSKGVGKNMFYSTEKENQIKKLPENIGVANVGRLIGNYLTLEYGKGEQRKVKGTGELHTLREKWFNSKLNAKSKRKILNRLEELGYIPVSAIADDNIHNDIDFIKPTTINGFASVYALFLNNRLWSRYYQPYNDSAVLNVLESIKKLRNINTTTVEEYANFKSKAFNNIKSFIISNNLNNLMESIDVVEERKRLLIDTKDHKSIATITHELKEEGLISNEFVNRLDIKLKTTVIPSSIIYKANLAENIDEKPIYAAIASMLVDTRELGEFNGKMYTVQSLIQDLITSQLITGGVQSTKQFTKYVPPSYFDNKGLYERIRDIDFSDTADFNSTAYLNQHIQHNPKDVMLSVEQKLLINAKSYRYFNNKTIIKKVDTLVNLPYVFSVRNIVQYEEHSEEVIKLYFYDSDLGYWVQRDILGYEHMKEFDGKNLYGRSVIKANQTPVATRIDIPVSITNTLNFTKGLPTDSEIIEVPKNEKLDVEYGLSTSEPSIKRMENVLGNIIVKDSNKLNTYLAKELLKNIDKLSDYQFKVNTSIKGEGRHSAKRKTIEINPLKIKTAQRFEDTVLEELIHGFTSKAVDENKHGEILRLKGYRDLAEDAVRKHLGKDADRLFELAKTKIKNQEKLSTVEYNLIYPVLSTKEFIGRLHKSKELQKIINEVDVQGKAKKGLLHEIWEFILDIFQTLGLDIKQDKVLAHALADIVSFINKEVQVENAKAEEIKALTQKTRTPKYLYDYFNLKDDKGQLKDIENAGELASFINENIKNVTTRVKGKTVIIETKLDNGQLDLFSEDMDDMSLEEKQHFKDEDFDLHTKGVNKGSVLLNLYNYRLRVLSKNIEKAKQAKDYNKVLLLEDTHTALETRRHELLVIKDTSSLLHKGEQDMDEISQLLKNDLSVADVIYIRLSIDFWKRAERDLLSEDEKLSDVITKRLKEIERLAQIYENKLIEIEDNHMTNLLKKYGEGKTVDEIANYMRDINRLRADVLDISRSDSPLLDVAFLDMKHANIRTNEESSKIIKEINVLEEKILPILKGMKNSTELYELFRQYTTNGKLTGHIVNRFTAEFYKRYKRIKNNATTKKTYTSFTSYVKWSGTHLEDVNLHHLFPMEELSEAKQKVADAYKAKLKAKYGEDHYNEYVTEQGKLIDKYKEYRRSKIVRLLEKYAANDVNDLFTNQAAVIEYNKWVDLNSPYSISEYIKKGVPEKYKDYKGFNIPYHIYALPKNPASYDNNYKKIEENADLYEFYTYFKKLDRELKSYISVEDRANLAMNGIPYVTKLILEQYQHKGMKAGLLPIWDAIKQSVSTYDEDNIVTSYINPNTNKKENELGTNLTKNNSKIIDTYISNKIAEHRIEHKTPPERKLINLWREDIIDELAQKKSYDLPKVLRIYAMTVLAYKHKVRVEDNLKLVENVLTRQKEPLRNKKGEVMKNLQGGIEYKTSGDSFINMRKQYQYYMDAFYGITKDEEGVDTNRKVFTEEENLRKDEIKDSLLKLEMEYKNGKLTPEQYEDFKNELDGLLEDLGSYAVWSKRGDAILKYVQLKGMGWNVMSSIANIGFGFISNFIEGAGGQIYTNKSLRSAYSLLGGSMLKNWTFNKVETPTAKKIRRMMDNGDVLKDSSKELFTNPLSVKLSKSNEWLAPYNLTQRTEYLNQSPLMIAIMMDTVYKDGNIWDAFDNEGNWKTEEYGEKPQRLLDTISIKIDQTVKMNHGNYDPNSPLRAKKTLLGRALMQFRTWMLEGAATRFEGEREDKALGITRKGRYVSLVDYFKEVGFGRGTVDVLKGFTNVVSFGKIFEDNDFENENLTESDAANMRKIMAEVTMLISLQLAYISLSSMISDLDDEDDKISKYTLNLLFNQGMRLKTDILFYVSPSEFKNLTRDLIPALALIKDTSEFFSATYKFIEGEDRIERGVYSGYSRLLRETSQMLPFTTQLYKNVNYTVQTFDKN